MKCVNRAIESKLPALKKELCQSYLNPIFNGEVKIHVYAKLQTSSERQIQVENFSE